MGTKQRLPGSVSYDDLPQNKVSGDGKSVTIRKDYGDGNGLNGRVLGDLFRGIYDSLNSLKTGVSGLIVASGGSTASVTMPTVYLNEEA